MSDREWRPAVIPITANSTHTAEQINEIRNRQRLDEIARKQRQDQLMQEQSQPPNQTPPYDRPVNIG